jgi:hypothetical protein
MLIVHDRKQPGANVGTGLPKVAFGNRAHQRLLHEIVRAVGRPGVTLWLMAEALGCYAEYAESPKASAGPSAPGPKVEEGMVGFVNFKTDYRAGATTVRFSSRET